MTQENTEKNIIFENQWLYVIKCTGGYEIRKHSGTHSVVIGKGADADNVIRVALAISKHPKNIAKI